MCVETTNGSWWACQAASVTVGTSKQKKKSPIIILSSPNLESCSEWKSTSRNLVGWGMVVVILFYIRADKGAGLVRFKYQSDMNMLMQNGVRVHIC